MSKAHDSPHLPQNRSTPKITTKSKTLRRPRNERNLYIEAQPLPSPAPGPPKKGFVPQKVTTKSETVRSTTTRAQSRKASPLDHHVVQACTVDTHLKDLERNCCAVRVIKFEASLDSYHKNPFCHSVTTMFGEKSPVEMACWAKKNQRREATNQA